MIIGLKKSEILKVIQIMQNIVSARASIPILSHILLKAEKDKVKISATDLEIGMNCFVEADIKEKGTAALPGRTFFDIIRLAPDESVLFEGNDEKIEIKSGKSRFKINCLPADEFPRIPDEEKDGGFSLTQKDVRTLVRKTLFAVSKEESRYALNGVFISISGGEITAVATDGRRLSLLSKDIDDKKIQKKVIVPAKGLSELNRIVENSDEDINVSIGENEILFRKKDVVLMARLIKGEFVDYERIIPRDYNVRVQMERESFLSLLKRSSILMSETSKMVKITLSDNKITTTAATELGESHDEMEIDYSGEEMTVAFNPEYLLDYLQNETSGDLFVDIVNPKSPVVFRPADEEGYIYIVMPLKLQ
jgi:DNA polymerase III subunit beta